MANKAYWEESFYYDKKTDDVYMIPQCSACGFHHKGTYHEQGEIWKLQECPECGAEMEKKKKRWIDE